MKKSLPPLTSQPPIAKPSRSTSFVGYVNVRGRHAVMYGDRGLGKTSLVTVLNDLFSQTPGIQIIKVNCNQTDTFFHVWRKAFVRIPKSFEPNPGKGEGARSVEANLEEELVNLTTVGPGEICRLLESVCDAHHVILVFDEFDKLPETDRAMFADIIKELSDNSINATLILVGVARNVIELSEHHSIDRCLAQILMPPMERAELKGILTKAMDKLGMAFHEDAANFVLSLSQGLPHYTHSLGQEATYKAIESLQDEVTNGHLSAALKCALENTLMSIRESYQKAAEGQRKGTLFPDVLLACAIARVDEQGYFSSADVRETLREITRKEYDIPNFSQHLDKFSSDPNRGPILEKWGAPRRFRFRFRDRLLRPYIVMKGLTEGKITGSLLEQVDAAGNT